MHELGHLVGLNHVSVKTELMYPENLGQRAFGAGDREGLRQLGLGPCFTN
jgi:predicted Zn-dependent protease